MDCKLCKFCQKFINLFKFRVVGTAPAEKTGGNGNFLKDVRMANSDSNQRLSDSQLKREAAELPDCLPCKIIGAGACFGSSAYLLIRRNTFGQTRAARSAIGIVAAGMYAVMPSLKQCDHFRGNYHIRFHKLLHSV